MSKGGDFTPLDTYLEEMQKLKAENEKLARALRVAAGYISMTDGFADNHPEDVYEWLLLEAEAIRRSE